MEEKWISPEKPPEARRTIIMAMDFSGDKFIAVGYYEFETFWFSGGDDSQNGYSPAFVHDSIIAWMYAPKLP